VREFRSVIAREWRQANTRNSDSPLLFLAATFRNAAMRITSGRETEILIRHA